MCHTTVFPSQQCVRQCLLLSVPVSCVRQCSRGQLRCVGSKDTEISDYFKYITMHSLLWIASCYQRELESEQQRRRRRNPCERFSRLVQTMISYKTLWSPAKRSFQCFILIFSHKYSMVWFYIWKLSSFSPLIINYRCILWNVAARMYLKKCVILNYFVALWS